MCVDLFHVKNQSVKPYQCNICVLCNKLSFLSEHAIFCILIYHLPRENQTVPNFQKPKSSNYLKCLLNLVATSFGDFCRDLHITKWLVWNSSIIILVLLDNNTERLHRLYCTLQLTPYFKEVQKATFKPQHIRCKWSNETRESCIAMQNAFFFSRMNRSNLALKYISDQKCIYLSISTSAYHLLLLLQ